MPEMRLLIFAPFCLSPPISGRVPDRPIESCSLISGDGSKSIRGSVFPVVQTRFRPLLLFCFLTSSFTFAQQITPQARITGPVNNAALITLRGNRHPLARAQFDKGAAPDAVPLNRMLLLLGRSDEQQAALDQLIEEQHTPGSANYRKWLTAAEIGRRFGPADTDVQTVSSWLRQQGFSVTRVSAGKIAIEFAGSAGQVREAFHTEIHKYVVNGREHWANAQDPQ